VLFDLHRVWGYAAIVANALAGVYTLVAWKWPRFRGRWLWWPTIVAETMMMIQVLLGVLMVSVQDYEPLPRNPAGKVLKSVLRGRDTAFATADDQAL
jgi:heme A synthase